MTAQWQGPFALALYIPAPHGSDAGNECRDRVLDYVRQNSLQGADSYAVSLLYASGEVPNLHCELSGDLTGFEKPYVNHATFDRRFRGQPWTVLWNADYPVNELRTVARSMVRRRSVRAMQKIRRGLRVNVPPPAVLERYAAPSHESCVQQGSCAVQHERIAGGLSIVASTRR